MDKIFWTDDEVSKLVDILVPMRMNDPSPPLLTLLKRAQQQLPENRRRHLRTVTGLANLVHGLEIRLNDLKELAVKGNQPAPPPPKVPTEEEVLANVSIDKLVSCAVKKFQQGMNDIQENFERMAIRLLSSNPFSANHSSNGHVVKRTKVAIVGLLGNQKNAVQEAIGNSLDLRFIPKEQKHPSFPQVDRVFLCVDFLDHGWENAAMSKFGREKVYRHKGGISGLIEALQKVGVDSK